MYRYDAVRELTVMSHIISDAYILPLLSYTIFPWLWIEIDIHAIIISLSVSTISLSHSFVAFSRLYSCFCVYLQYFYCLFFALCYLLISISKKESSVDSMN